MRRQVGNSMEAVSSLLTESGLELKLSSNRRNQDETTVFLYDVENYFVIGANDPTLDRDRLHKDKLKYHYQEDEEFQMTFPHLAPTGEIQQIEKTLKCTQIINTDDFNQTSKGLLVMRLHFLVTSYIDLYLWCPQTK